VEKSGQNVLLTNIFYPISKSLIKYFKLINKYYFYT
jgi:hypothetical protein